MSAAPCRGAETGRAVSPRMGAGWSLGYAQCSFCIVVFQLSKIGPHLKNPTTDALQEQDFSVTCRLIRLPCLVCGLPVAALLAAAARGLYLRWSVRRVRALFQTSFRPRLAATPLSFTKLFS